MLLTLLAALLAAAPGPSAATDAPPVIRFENATGVEIVGLYISECGAQDYWDNLLERPGYGPMAHGATAEFRVPPGCYDLHASPDGADDLHQTGLSLEDDMLHLWTVEVWGEVHADPAMGVLWFSNRTTGRYITQLIVTECGGEGGNEYLNGGAIPPGEAFEIELWPGCWELYVQNEAGFQVLFDPFTVRSGEVVERWVQDRR